MEFNSIIGSGERVLWRGKPEAFPFFAHSLLAAAFLPAFALVGFFVASSNGPYPFYVMPWHVYLILALAAFGGVMGWLQYLATEYAITDKRVFIQSGIIGRDFKTLDLDRIDHAEVHRDFLDIVCGMGTGTIKIYSPTLVTVGKKGTYPAPMVFRFIRDPHGVFNFFKKVSFDVKTDVHYPNAMRPGQNPGYRTDLRNGSEGGM